MRFIFLIVLTLSSLFKATAHSDSLLKVITNSPSHQSAIKFTENAGQWSSPILFKSQLDGGLLFVERDGLTFNFYDKKKYRAIHKSGLLKQPIKDLTIKSHAYKVKFEGCNRISQVAKQQEGVDYENFYLGNDPSKWRGNVHNYRQVFLNDIYPGIDYELVAAIQGVKYNFHVKAGADASLIRIRYDGVTNLKLEKGALKIGLTVNEGLEYKPFAYQMIDGKVVEVPCRYVLKDQVLTFEFPSGYNKKETLIIDPVLVFAAQSGSTADNFGMTATFDPQGNLYSGGTVFDPGYPTTTGAFDNSFNGTSYYGNSDVFITKYSSNGTTLIYSTYIGGNYTESVNSMIVDQNNNLCFFGVTSSGDFPMTTGAYDNSFNGGSFLMFVYNGQRYHNGTDLYITKLNANGTALLASTYLGGSGNDGVNHTDSYSLQFAVPATPPSTGTIVVTQPDYDSLFFNYGDQCRGEIQLDLSNNIYIASCTRSSNFPTANSFDNTLGGKQDGIVAKLDPNLSNLLYSSYVGGSSNDACYGIIVKNNFEVYVTGGTSSSNFGLMSGGYQSSYQGGKCDGFVLRINANGNAVLNGTYFGTSSYDQAYFIQADKYNNVYIYGQSLGSVPVLAASNETVVFSVAGTHQFIARFNSTLSQLNLCTKFGHYTNNVDISPSAFAVDKCNNIYLSGWGGSLLNTNNPLTGMPLFQATQSTSTGYDFYFMGLDSNAKALKYGSYFGGGTSQEHVDGGTSRFDPQGRIYQSVCAGCGGNDDFPVTSGAWPNTPGNSNHSTNCNNGVIKLDFQLVMTVATIVTNTLAGCSPVTVTFTNSTPSSGPGSSYTWYLGNNVVTSTSLSPTMTYTTPGTYTVALVVRNNATCNKKDSAITFVTVYPSPDATIAANYSPCSNTISLSQTNNASLGNSPYAWDLGNSSGIYTTSSVSYTYANTGVYQITFTLTAASGCKVIKTQTVSIFNFTPNITPPLAVCEGSTAQLQASGGNSYMWSIGSQTSANIQVTPSSSTIYSVVVINTSPGYTCQRTLTTQVNVRPLPLSLFTVDYSTCSNTVSTKNNSSGNLSSNPYTWNFGDGSSNVQANAPSYTYSTNGTYVVTLLVTDVYGCQKAVTQTVTVFNFKPSAVTSGTLCYGNSMVLNALGGTSYSWMPANSLNNATIAAPIASPTISTIYTVTIANDSPGYVCSKSMTTNLRVDPTPTTSFNYSMNPCGGGVYFYDKSSPDVSAWSWTLAPAITRTVENPYNFYSNGGKFVVVLQGTNEFGCTDTSAREIVVGAPPQVGITNSLAICIGSKVQLSATGGISYTWMPANTVDFPNQAQVMVSPTVTTEYSVEVMTDVLVNGKNCQFLLTTGVEVWRLSSAAVTAKADPVIIIVGNSTTLRYLGDPGATVQWLPLGATTPGFGYTVTAKPDKPTTYTAVANKGPCTENVEVHVDAFTEGCLGKDVFVPNTFTPNDDGVNDKLYARGIKVDEIYFAIYNRWGEKVFETTDKNVGWDGWYNGKQAEAGVYGWYLSAKCYNGEETFRKGNVTLVR